MVRQMLLGALCGALLTLCALLPVQAAAAAPPTVPVAGQGAGPGASLAPPPPPPPSGPGNGVASSGGTPVPAPADLAQSQLQGVDTAGIATFVNEIGAQLGPDAGFGWHSLGDFLHGGGLLRHPDRLLTALTALFAGELRQSLGLLGKLLVLVVLAGVVRQIQGAFENEAVGHIADAVIFLALGVLCLVGFTLAVRLARGAVGDLSSFMVALLPAMVGLLAAGGSVTTAGLMHPAMVAAVNAVGIHVRAVVFPLVLLAAVLDIVSAFTPSFKLTSLAALIRQISLGVLGLLFTVFLGVVAVSGAAGAVADGVALRAAKYASKAFVPIVGGMFADTAELILTSGFLLRSGLGLLGLVTIVLLVVIPVLKMLALWAVYRLAAAVAQPVGGEGVASVLGGVGGALVLLTVAVAVVGLMCFLSLAALVGAGSAAFMLH